ncbi:hypothetical protein ACEPAH_9587 [Sanghuangporus vaninii]
MVITRRMAEENASRNIGSGSDAPDDVAADQASNAAIYRDAVRGDVNNRASSRRTDAIRNDETLQPYISTENDSIEARSKAAVRRSGATPRRRSNKATPPNRLQLVQQATTKANGSNTNSGASSANRENKQRSPVKRGEKRRREGEAEESNKENSANDDCETVPKSVRRIRRRAAKAPNDESETTPTNKASLFAAGDSSNRDFLRCVSSCSEHPEADTIAACALVELSSGKLIQEDEIRNAVYRFASGRKLKMVHPVPTVIA